MNILDIIIAVILIGGAIQGFRKGFFHQIATLAALIAGVFIAILFSNVAGSIISEFVNWNPDVIKVVAFIVLFIIAAGLIRLLGTVLTGLFKAMMLGLLNKL
ncbi:MAG: CvpA family protein, partial [Bacteroidales bacterium]|nr:CvpA family protein [Bacteroidales bacterium]